MEPTEYDKEFIEDGGDSDDDDEKSWDDDEDSDDEGGNTEATDGSGDEEEENNAQSEDDNHADTVKRSKKSVKKASATAFARQALDDDEIDVKMDYSIAKSLLGKWNPHVDSHGRIFQYENMIPLYRK